MFKLSVSIKMKLLDNQSSVDLFVAISRVACLKLGWGLFEIVKVVYMEKTTVL